MEKKFRVVAKSTIMDAEMDFRDRAEAYEMYQKFRDGGSYSMVYVMNNETGQLYHRYNIRIEGGGVTREEWFSIDK